MPTRINFDQWTPDQSSTTTMVDANNVYPTQFGYAPFNGYQNFTIADVGQPLNSVFSGRWGADSITVAGSGSDTTTQQSAKLYRFNSNTLQLEDVSQTGAYVGKKWNFVQFGKYIICANGNAKLQAWSIGTSTQFADLAINAPTAKYVTTVRDFVFTGYLGTQASTKVQWSDINAETVWEPGPTSQAGSQYLPDGGNIVGLSGGEFGLVFLEKAIYRATYIGSPLFFQFDNISRGVGCLEGNSIIQNGSITYFLSDSGFYKCDGQSVTPIGVEKVDRYFFKNAKLNNLESMSAISDPVKKLIIWNYMGINGERNMLVYNWAIDKWSRVTTEVDGLAILATSGVTLEGLVQIGHTNLDTIEISLDSAAWSGGKLLFGGYKGGQIVIFSKQNDNAELVTQDLEFGTNSVVKLVRPQINHGSAWIKIASRRNLDDDVIFSPTAKTSSEGRASVRSVGRYHRICVMPTGQWTHALGVDVDVQKQGHR